MKQAVDRQTFQVSFMNLRPKNFTFEGLDILFSHLEELETETGEELELDIIALCCDYAEDTPANIAADYGADIEAAKDDDDIFDIVAEFLDAKGVLIGCTESSIVYRQF